MSPRSPRVHEANARTGAPRGEGVFAEDVRLDQQQTTGGAGSHEPERTPGIRGRLNLLPWRGYLAMMDAIAGSADWVEGICAAPDLPMPATDESAELVRRMAEGEPAALASLYAIHGQKMYAFARRLTGDPALAEDVTQEALVAAWQSARRFRGEGSVRAWLLGIVHHLAFKAMRRRRWQPISKELTATLDSPAPSPEEKVQAGELATCVRRGIETLSFKHRAALDLVFYHGLSLEQAAQVCGCPVGTIKSRLSYAKAHLREVLARAGVAGEDLG